MSLTALAGHPRPITAELLGIGHPADVRTAMVLSEMLHTDPFDRVNSPMGPSGPRCFRVPGLGGPRRAISIEAASLRQCRESPMLGHCPGRRQSGRRAERGWPSWVMSMQVQGPRSSTTMPGGRCRRRGSSPRQAAVSSRAVPCSTSKLMRGLMRVNLALGPGRRAAEVLMPELRGDAGEPPGAASPAAGMPHYFCGVAFQHTLQVRVGSHDPEPWD